MRMIVISPPVIEEYENGNIFFEELTIADSNIDVTSSSKYKAVANNSISGDIRYSLKNGWTLSELKIYRRDKLHSLDMFYGALEESENLTDLNNVIFGEYETYLYFFIENLSQNKKAKLYILVERFDELNIDFNSLVFNKSYISIKTPDKLVNLYYIDTDNTSPQQFTSVDDLVSKICIHTSAVLRSEMYLSEDNIYTTEYDFSDNILNLRLSKISEIESVCAVIDDTEKTDCLIKN